MHTLNDTDFQTTFDELVEPLATRVAMPRCADGNGTLTFLDYLKAVNKRMPGRAAAAAGKGDTFKRGALKA